MTRVVGNLFDINRETSPYILWGNSLLRHIDRADSKVKFLTLYAYVSGAATPHSTFRLHGATAGYTPGSGKKFIAMAVKGKTSVGGAASFHVQGGASDVGFSNGTGATSRDTGTNNGFRIAFYAGAGGGEVEKTLPLVFEAGRYPQLYFGSGSAGTGFFTMVGYEVDTTITSLDDLP